MASASGGEPFLKRKFMGEMCEFCAGLGMSQWCRSRKRKIKYILRVFGDLFTLSTSREAIYFRIVPKES